MGKKKVKDTKPALQGDWAAGLSGKPVFIDGLTHDLFYLIVAAKNSADSYQCVVIGRFGRDSFKVKFYGSFEDWGFTYSSLQDKFQACDYVNHKEDAGYERYFTNQRGVQRLLAALSGTRGVTVCPVEGFLDAYNIPMDTRKFILDQIQHPRGGRQPQLTFFPKGALTAA